MTAPILTGSERRALRAQGQLLEPTVMVGRDGVTDAIVRDLQTQLSRTALIKVRVHAPDRHVRQELFEALAARTDSAIAGSVGHTALYYRPLASA